MDVLRRSYTPKTEPLIGSAGMRRGRRISAAGTPNLYTLLMPLNQNVRIYTFHIGFAKIAALHIHI